MPTCSADNDNVNANDLRSSFANNDNDNVNDLRSSFANNDNVNDLRSSFTNNDNVNDNQGTRSADDLRSSFANNFNDNDNVKDNVIYQFDEKHQRGKPNNKECPTNTISININGELQSWLNDDNIITEATLLILASIYFDKLYIIGPNGDQYIGFREL